MVKYGDIEYLRCVYCGYLNELKLNWRNTGDRDDTHYITCENCKRVIGINNQARHPKNKRLFKNIIE